MSRILLLLLTIVLVAPSFVSGEEASFDIHVKSDEAAYAIGDIINIRITVKGKGFSLGDIDKKALLPFEYSGKEEAFSEESGVTTLTVKGHIFKVGEFTLPALDVKDREGTSHKTQPLKITVKALLKGDEQGIKPLKPQVDIDEGGPLWPWIVVIILLAAIMAAILFLRRMKGEVEPEKIHIEMIPPHVEALRELERIEGLKLLKEGKIKAYHTLVSDVVRNFEGRIYGFDAMEMTTGEIMDALEKRASKNLASISKFLNHCDMVKFAKYTPPEMDISGLLGRAREIIHKDMPQEPANSEKEVGDLAL